MDEIIRKGLLLLLIINPFSQMVYLADLMDQNSGRNFTRIYAIASLTTIAVCVIFAVAGEFIIFDIFQVDLSAMRIFGGLVILGVAYVYIVQGPTGLKLFRGDVTEIAHQIALPLMVGPGVIWMAVTIGESFNFITGFLVITAVFVINAVMVLIYFYAYKHAKGPLELALIKYFAIAMRLNAFMMGAVSVHMIISGVFTYYDHFMSSGGV